MTADGLADLSASARAEFSGVMVIDTVATAAGKPKTLYITGAFYTGEAVMGVFKYFNKYDYTFEPESRWMVHTTVALFDAASVSKAGVTIDPEDEFDVMGDIFYLSPANDAPAKHPPLVRVSGRPSNIVQEAASFDIDAGQWTSFANQRAVFPFSGSIPEQWTNKPMPNPNSLKFIGVTGTLAGIRLVGTLRRFCVDIVSVTFLGPAPPAYTTQASTLTPKGKRKAGISFEDKPTPTKKVRN